MTGPDITRPSSTARDHRRGGLAAAAARACLTAGARRADCPPRPPAWNTAAATTGAWGEPHSRAAAGGRMLFALMPRGKYVVTGGLPGLRCGRGVEEPTQVQDSARPGRPV